MKQLLITIGAVLLVGCKPSEDEKLLVARARAGNVEEVKKLLSNGISPNSVDLAGNSALGSASNNGHLKVVEMLISQGANVNAKDPDGTTALHLSAMMEKESIIKHLIASGAELNPISVGLTPLDLAQDRNNDESINLLRKHGAKTAKELKTDGSATYLDDFIQNLGPNEKKVALVVSLAGTLFVILLIKLFYRKKLRRAD